MDWEIINRHQRNARGTYHVIMQDVEDRTPLLPREHKGHRERRKPESRLNSGQIKTIALTLMVLDHVGALFLPYGSVAWLFTRGIGRLSFPLYAYLAGQGIRHTHDIGAYMLRLLAFAFLSEIPFDLAVSGKCFAYGYQNVFFTLALAVSTQWVCQACSQHRDRGWKLAVYTVCAGAVAQLIHTDYGMCGVFLISALACAGGKKKAMAATVWCFVFVKSGWIFPGLTIRAAASTVLVAVWLCIVCMDNGVPGNRKWRKWFYVAYPVHLAALWLLRMAVSRS